jgi:hypothetical protein
MLRPSQEWCIFQVKAFAQLISIPVVYIKTPSRGVFIDRLMFTTTRCAHASNCLIERLNKPFQPGIIRRNSAPAVAQGKLS